MLFVRSCSIDKLHVTGATQTASLWSSGVEQLRRQGFDSLVFGSAHDGDWDASQSSDWPAPPFYIPLNGSGIPSGPVVVPCNPNDPSPSQMAIGAGLVAGTY